jgi:hypothetical protein
MIDKNKIRYNIDALIYLFSNEQTYTEILNATNLAGEYIKNNKRYCYNYINTETKENVKFDNIAFYNMFARPVSFLNKNGNCKLQEQLNKYGSCQLQKHRSCQLRDQVNNITNNYSQYEFKMRTIKDNEINFLMSYAISNYYYKRILNKIEKCRNMNERPGTEYCSIIKIPIEYFPQIQPNEIYKTYTSTQLLKIYYNTTTNKNRYI